MVMLRQRRPPHWPTHRNSGNLAVRIGHEASRMIDWCKPHLVAPIRRVYSTSDSHQLCQQCWSSASVPESDETRGIDQTENVELVAVENDM